MKKVITLILAASILAVAGLNAQTIKVATVDMRKLYEDYWKTSEALNKIKKSFDSAKEEQTNLMEQGQGLVEEYKALAERAQSDLLSETARQEAAQKAQEKLQEIQQKEQEVKAFNMNTQRALAQRQQHHREVMVEEILAVVKEVARNDRSNLVFDTSGMDTGIPAVLYAEPTWDITERVLNRLNADAPTNF